MARKQGLLIKIFIATVWIATTPVAGMKRDASDLLTIKNPSENICIKKDELQYNLPQADTFFEPYEFKDVVIKQSASHYNYKTIFSPDDKNKYIGHLKTGDPDFDAKMFFVFVATSTPEVNDIPAKKKDMYLLGKTLKYGRRAFEKISQLDPTVYTEKDLCLTCWKKNYTELQLFEENIANITFTLNIMFHFLFRFACFYDIAHNHSFSLLDEEELKKKLYEYTETPAMERLSDDLLCTMNSMLPSWISLFHDPDEPERDRLLNLETLKHYFNNQGTVFIPIPSKDEGVIGINPLNFCLTQNTGVIGIGLKTSDAHAGHYKSIIDFILHDFTHMLLWVETNNQSKFLNEGLLLRKVFLNHAKSLFFELISEYKKANNKRNLEKNMFMLFFILHEEGHNYNKHKKDAKKHSIETITQETFNIKDCVGIKSYHINDLLLHDFLFNTIDLYRALRRFDDDIDRYMAMHNLSIDYPFTLKNTITKSLNKDDLMMFLKISQFVFINAYRLFWKSYNDDRFEGMLPYTVAKNTVTKTNL